MAMLSIKNYVVQMKNFYDLPTSKILNFTQSCFMCDTNNNLTIFNYKLTDNCSSSINIFICSDCINHNQSDIIKKFLTLLTNAYKMLQIRSNQLFFQNIHNHYIPQHINFDSENKCLVGNVKLLNISINGVNQTGYLDPNVSLNNYSSKGDVIRICTEGNIHFMKTETFFAKFH